MTRRVVDHYLFFHIPKTAGSSLRQYFRSLLGDEQVGPPEGTPLPFGADASQLDCYRMIVGHFSFEQVALFPGWRVLTFLRNPVDVAVSTYYYSRNTPELVPTPMVALCRALPLRDVLKSREGRQIFANEAVRRFAGHEAYSMPDREALALAKGNLAACDFVGIHEQMDDSIVLMSATFGWPLHSLPRSNVTSGRPSLVELDRDLTDAILEATHLDAELYRFGVGLFEERRREMLKRLVREDRTAREEPPDTAPHTAQARVVAEAPLAAMSDAPPTRTASSGVRILSTVVTGRDSGRAVVRSGERCEIRVVLLAHTGSTHVAVVLRLFNSVGTLVYSTRTSRAGTYLALEAGDATQVVFDIWLTVSPGAYHVDLEVCSSTGPSLRLMDYVHKACTVDVIGFTAWPFAGVADLAAHVYTVDAGHGALEYEVGHEIDFTTSGNSQLYTRSGWADPEPSHRWTDGPQAELLCRLSSACSSDLLFTALVMPYCPGRTLDVTAVVNGRELGRWQFVAHGVPSEIMMHIPADTAAQGYLHMVFQIDRPHMPAVHGPSNDPRALGLAFERVVICDAAALPLATRSPARVDDV
jgi:hypothetical protein